MQKVVHPAYNLILPGIIKQLHTIVCLDLCKTDETEAGENPPKRALN